MSFDKLVDSAQLDSDLTTVADAIRTKGGTSAQLAFPAGFVSAVEAIPSGGEDTLTQLLAGTLEEYENDTPDAIKQYTFNSAKGIKRARFPYSKMLEQSLFSMCGSIESVFAPKAALCNSCFYGAKNLRVCVSKTYYSGTSAFSKYAGTMMLHTVDFTKKSHQGITENTFKNCENLKTLILRQAVLYPLTALNAFNGTPFASGGTGGTIYIPKALYDHLGDGTADDYKAATNWSTIDGYGTITWAKIEGSIYETAYADGTPIT